MNADSVLIYLAACVVNDRKPDRTVIEKLKSENGLLTELIFLSRQHQMSALIAAALVKTEVHNNVLIQERARAVCLERTFDHDRKKITEELENAGIWYMPLKGVILKEFYPQIGIREMSDNDILFDSERAGDVRTIMTELGFTNTSYGEGHRDDYEKKPASHFEMHRKLFDENNYHKPLYFYYNDVKKRLIKDEDSEFGFHFSREDFYIYITAHEYSHYITGGTGLRSLLDVYVYLEKYSGELDWDYIRNETDKLELTDFEKQNRRLAQKLFSLKLQTGQQNLQKEFISIESDRNYSGEYNCGEISNLTQEEKDILKYHVNSGVYGTWDQAIRSRAERKGMGRYLISRVFLPMRLVKDHYPVFYKYKILLLFLPLYRLIIHNRRALFEIGVLIRFGRQKRKAE